MKRFLSLALALLLCLSLLPLGALAAESDSEEAGEENAVAELTAEPAEEEPENSSEENGINISEETAKESADNPVDETSTAVSAENKAAETTVESVEDSSKDTAEDVAGETAAESVEELNEDAAENEINYTAYTLGEEGSVPAGETGYFTFSAPRQVIFIYANHANIEIRGTGRTGGMSSNIEDGYVICDFENYYDSYELTVQNTSDEEAVTFKVVLMTDARFQATELNTVYNFSSYQYFTFIAPEDGTYLLSIDKGSASYARLEHLLNEGGYYSYDETDTTLTLSKGDIVQLRGCSEFSEDDGKTLPSFTLLQLSKVSYETGTTVTVPAGEAFYYTFKLNSNDTAWLLYSENADITMSTTYYYQTYSVGNKVSGYTDISSYLGDDWRSIGCTLLVKAPYGKDAKLCLDAPDSFQFSSIAAGTPETIPGNTRNIYCFTAAKAGWYEVDSGTASVQVRSQAWEYRDPIFYLSEGSMVYFSTDNFASDEDAVLTVTSVTNIKPYTLGTTLALNSGEQVCYSFTFDANTEYVVTDSGVYGWAMDASGTGECVTGDNKRGYDSILIIDGETLKGDKLISFRGDQDNANVTIQSLDSFTKHPLTLNQSLTLAEGVYICTFTPSESGYYYFTCDGAVSGTDNVQVQAYSNSAENGGSFEAYPALPQTGGVEEGFWLDANESVYFAVRTATTTDSTRQDFELTLHAVEKPSDYPQNGTVTVGNDSLRYTLSKGTYFVTMDNAEFTLFWPQSFGKVEERNYSNSGNFVMQCKYDNAQLVILQGSNSESDGSVTILSMDQATDATLGKAISFDSNRLVKFTASKPGYYTVSSGKSVEFYDSNGYTMSSSTNSVYLIAGQTTYLLGKADDTITITETVTGGSYTMGDTVYIDAGTSKQLTLDMESSEYYVIYGSEVQIDIQNVDTNWYYYTYSEEESIGEFFSLISTRYLNCNHIYGLATDICILTLTASASKTGSFRMVRLEKSDATAFTDTSISCSTETLYCYTSEKDGWYRFTTDSLSNTHFYQQSKSDQQAWGGTLENNGIYWLSKGDSVYLDVIPVQTGISCTVTVSELNGNDYDNYALKTKLDTTETLQFFKLNLEAGKNYAVDSSSSYGWLLSPNGNSSYLSSGATLSGNAFTENCILLVRTYGEGSGSLMLSAFDTSGDSANVTAIAAGQTVKTDGLYSFTSTASGWYGFEYTVYCDVIDSNGNTLYSPFYLSAGETIYVKPYYYDSDGSFKLTAIPSFEDYTLETKINVASGTKYYTFSVKKDTVYYLEYDPSGTVIDFAYDHGNSSETIYFTMTGLNGSGDMYWFAAPEDGIVRMQVRSLGDSFVIRPAASSEVTALQANVWTTVEIERQYTFTPSTTGWYYFRGDNLYFSLNNYPQENNIENLRENYFWLKAGETVIVDINGRITRYPSTTGSLLIELAATNILEEISVDAPANKIIEQVQGLDQNELKTNMESGAILEKLSKLEESIGGTATVQSSVSSIPATSVSVVGAGFNRQSDDVTPTLIISAPEDDHNLPDGYNTDNAIQLSLTLTGVTDSTDLDVPVSITIPIPNGMNKSDLIIVHYHDGKTTLIKPEIEDNYARFVVSGFSDFALVESNHIAGDIDGNKTINILDLVRLLKAVVGQKTNTTYTDVNGDGITSILDVITLLKKVVGQSVDIF